MVFDENRVNFWPNTFTNLEVVVHGIFWNVINFSSYWLTERSKVVIIKQMP